MDYIPEHFSTVELGTFDQAVCSPAAPSAEWSGVQISAPQRINIAADEMPVVPVCGYYLVPVLAAMDGRPLTVELQRVGSPAPWYGTMMEAGENEPEEPPPDDAPQASRASLVGVSTGGWFNIDAQRYLPLRLEPGSYDLTVTYAGARSNTLRLEIVAR